MEVRAMKLKKYIGAILGVCMLTLFAGCYEPLDITDSEMDMVAEYAAGVLVKHGTKATDTLLDREEQEEAFAEMATPTPRPTLAPSQEDKEPVEDDTQGDASGEKPTATPRPTATPVPDNTELTMRDLTALLDKKDFYFEYVDYESTVLYQGADDLFAAASEGKQLIVLKFKVTNRSDSAATLVLNKGASKEFIYTLRIDGKTIRPSLTLLDEDFYTSYDVTYQPGETKTCVLVFECSSEVSPEAMTLTVLRDVEGNEDSVLVKVK